MAHFLTQAPPNHPPSTPAVFALLLHHHRHHCRHRHRHHHLKLALGQVCKHLPTRDEGGAPQGREVEGGAEAVGEAEEEHGGDPAAGVLEGEAALGHLVLLGGAAYEVVDAALGVDLGFVLAGDVGELGAREDVEVVVGGMASRVALGADGGTEDDEVLGDTYRYEKIPPSRLAKRTPSCPPKRERKKKKEKKNTYSRG